MSQDLVYLHISNKNGNGDISALNNIAKSHCCVLALLYSKGALKVERCINISVYVVLHVYLCHNFRKSIQGSLNNINFEIYR